MGDYLQQVSVRPAAAQRQRGHRSPRAVPFAGRGSINESWSKQCPAMLSWSALTATTLVLASLLQAVATSALVVPQLATPPVASLFAATAALADGDDVGAVRADLPSGKLYATPASCSVPATEGRACIS